MTKTILITGSTDGIGFETAKLLHEQGHRVLLHGRSADKLEHVKGMLSNGQTVSTYLADLSKRTQVAELAAAVIADHESLDVLINNAGVFRMPQAQTPGGLDLRFVVNTIAPYLLSQLLLPHIPKWGRVVNLSSAAQSSVSLEALFGRVKLSDGDAYAQSKLAMTMWSRQLALNLGSDGPMVVAVNPGSLLGSKMVKEAFGIDGGDLSKGAEILCRAALSEEFATAAGKYFDNDSGKFANPHPDGLNTEKNSEVTRGVDELSQLASW